MIERKIIIDGCINCPFSEFVEMKFTNEYYYNCKQFGIGITAKKYMEGDIDERCKLPINIKSEK